MQPIKPMKAGLAPSGYTPNIPIKDIIERKYDGHRIMIHIYHDGLGYMLDSWSTQLKNSNRKLDDELQNLLLDSMLPGLYDGELHVDKPGQTSADVALLANRDKTVFTAFDMLGYYTPDGYMSITDLTLLARKRFLYENINNRYSEVSGSRFNQAPYHFVESKEEVDEFVSSMFDKGYEGAIIKHIFSKYYPGKRTKEWLKIKRCNHITMAITGYVPPNTPTAYGIIQLVNLDNKIRTSVKVPNLELREQFLQNHHRFMNRMVIVEYQDLIYSQPHPVFGDGKPKLRHPRFDRFEDE